MKSPFHRGGLRFFLVAAALAAGRSGLSSVLCGTPFILLGVLLQVAAKGCLLQDRTVTMAGPYRLVRHPFYLANALIDVGIALMSGWWLLLAVLPVWWLCVYLPVVRAEECRLVSLFPETYPAYKRRVPMFVPFRQPLPPSGDPFSWRNPNIACGRVLPRALRLLAYPLLFLVVSQFRADGLAFFTDDYGLHFGAFVFLLFIYGLAWLLELHLKRARRLIPQALSSVEFRMFAALLLVVVAATIPFLETESDAVMWGLGAVCLLFSLLVYPLSRHPQAALAAEGAILAAACFTCELFWLAPLPLLFYAALMLDSRLLNVASPESCDRPRPPLAARPTFCHLLQIAVVALAVAKEALLG
ncbi:MAG: isoprenylcysteine carboxylmethyltransferase family protein [Planctomycetota bacterium]